MSQADTTSPVAGPGTRADRFRVGATMLLSLLAGRSMYRLITLASTVLLLPAWGEERYRPFAAALASFSWLLALVFTGPEKTVLKLLPRAPRTGRLVTGAILALAWWLPLPLLAGFGLVLLTGNQSTALYLGVAAMLLGGGCTQLLVGLHRAHGRLRTDVTTFLLLSVGDLGLLVAALTGALGPHGFVGAIAVLNVLVNVVLSASLGRPSLRIRHRRGFLRRLGWTMLFLSGFELFLLLTSAVLFIVLDHSPYADQLGRLYVVVVVWSAGINLFLYLLRILAPRTALRLAGRGASAGRAQARRLAGYVIVANLAWLLLVGILVAGTGLAELTGVGQLAAWAGLLLARSPVLALLVRASFLLENTDAAGPRAVGLAGVVGLAAAVVAGLLLIPPLGGIGVLAAYAVAELAYAIIVGHGAGWKLRTARRQPPAALLAPQGHAR